LTNHLGGQAKQSVRPFLFLIVTINRFRTETLTITLFKKSTLSISMTTSIQYWQEKSQTSLKSVNR
jgi:hypothetical protein